MTAEETLRKSDLTFKERGQFELVIEIMEQYANAKVLEALDEITKRFKENVMLEPARIVIQTEVKPKYGKYN